MAVNILSTALLSLPLIAAAGNEGVVLDAVAFTEVSYIDRQELFSNICMLAKDRLVAVFTSAHAVAAVAAILNGIRPEWSVYCIGNTTRVAAEKHFGTSSIHGSATNAAALSTVILEHRLSGVTFFCSESRLDILPQALRAQGVTVSEVVVYQNTATPVSIRQEYDGILFFSPGAVSSFFSVNSTSPFTVLFAIGNTTAAAINTFTSNRIIICAEPSKEQVIADAIGYFTNKDHQPMITNITNERSEK